MKNLILSMLNYLWVALLLAIVCSALLAHIGIPLVAILGGMVLSAIATRFIMKSYWNVVTEYKPWHKWTISILTALVGSQMGWVALLI